MTSEIGPVSSSVYMPFTGLSNTPRHRALTEKMVKVCKNSLRRQYKTTQPKSSRKKTQAEWLYEMHHGQKRKGESRWKGKLIVTNQELGGGTMNPTDTVAVRGMVKDETTPLMERFEIKSKCAQLLKCLKCCF